MHLDYSDRTQRHEFFFSLLLISEHLLLMNTIVIQIKWVHAVLVYVW
jgi:hypothetical protein